jgi:murein DD-endopeptidase MepM/ murein hydrolase activator NlpD
MCRSQSPARLLVTFFLAFLLLLLIQINPVAAQEDAFPVLPAPVELAPPLNEVEASGLANDIDVWRLQPIPDEAASAGETPADSANLPSPIIKMKSLESGDSLIHGLAFAKGFIWASTRTSPARILRMNPNTLEYERITLPWGYREGDALIFAEGYVWVGLNTSPAKIIRVNPDTLEWTVAVSLDGMQNLANSLAFTNGHIWAGGRNGRLTRIDPSTLATETFVLSDHTSSTLLHALATSGDILWINVVVGSYNSVIVRLDTNDLSGTRQVSGFSQLADDIATSQGYLYAASEGGSANLYLIADDLKTTSVKASANYPSYGVFIDPNHDDLVYTSLVSRPGQLAIHQRSGTPPQLAYLDAYSMPEGYNYANEGAFDPDTGNLYITAWMSPARIVKFAPPNTTPDASSPFLELPFVYSGAFAETAQSTVNKGVISSFFDHQYPIGSPSGENGLMYLYNGTGAQVALDAYDCIRPLCYDSHDGIDFGKTGDALAAASGTIKDICKTSDKSCVIKGYGNSVLIDHQNGYATFYGHLDSFGSYQEGAPVPARAVIGKIGNTGTNSTAVHLHFGVYYDENGDKTWTRSEVVDPFGFEGGKDKDPAVAKEYPASDWLWIHQLKDSGVLAGIGDNITTPSADGRFTITETPLEPVRVEIHEGPLNFLPGFLLRPISAVIKLVISPFNVAASDLSEAEEGAAQAAGSLQIRYDAADVLHANTEQMAIHRWNASTRKWVPLASSTTDVVSATVTNGGQYALFAPPLCASDTSEPNDDVYSATRLAIGSTLTQYFDIANDSDWHILALDAKQSARITLEALGAGPNVQIRLLAANGTTTLRSARTSDSMRRVTLELSLAESGIVYALVSPISSTPFGCSAAYRLLAQTDTRTYLPSVNR